MWRGALIGVLGALVGCGPAVVLPSDDDPMPTTGSGAPTAPTPVPPQVTTGPSPGTTTAPPPWGSTSSATADGSSSGSSSSVGSDSVGFIPTDSEDSDACDPYLQNCAPGEKCVAYADDGGSSWNALGCFPVANNPGQAGDVCMVEGSGTSGLDSCDIGAMCWSTDENNTGTCVDQCQGSADAPYCSDPDTRCIVANEGVLALCLPVCDPLLANCPEGQRCFAVDQAFVCGPQGPGITAPAGAPCEDLTSCDPGLACVAAATYGPACPPGTAGCCSPYCDIDQPSCPEPNHGCVPLGLPNAEKLGLEHLGTCRLEP